MKLFATNDADQNFALFDPWTVIHTSFGLWAGLVGISFKWTMAAAVLYEMFEQVAEDQPWGQKIFRSSGRETIANLVSDVGVTAGGWWLGNKYHEPRVSGYLAPAARNPIGGR